MADDDSTTQDTGGRATVAVVNAKLDGLKDLVRAEFGAMQRQLDAVAALPFKVERLETQNKNQEKRLEVVEQELERRQQVDEARGESDRVWRKTHLPTIALTAVLAIVAIVGIVTQLH